MVQNLIPGGGFRLERLDFGGQRRHVGFGRAIGGGGCGDSRTYRQQQRCRQESSYYHRIGSCLGYKGSDFSSKRQYANMPKNEIVSASKGTTGYGHRDNCRGKRPNWKPARSKERRAVRGATYCCSEPRRATEGLLRESPEWRSSSQRDASSRRFAPRFARRAIETIRGPRIPFDAANRDVGAHSQQAAYRGAAFRRAAAPKRPSSSLRTSEATLFSG